VRHLREEFWMPRLFDRLTHTQWTEAGSKTMLDRAIERVDEVLGAHEPDWMDEEMQKEVDRIVAAAERESSD